MSFIEGTNPGFSKAVISVWFKVPQASMDAVQKEEDDWWDAHARDDPPTEPPPLLGMVPLVVFGQEGTTRISAKQEGESGGETTSTSKTICVEHAGDSFDGVTVTMWAWSECVGPFTDVRAIPSVTFSYEAVPGKPTNPSFIAVNGGGKLVINFESTQTGSVTLASAMTKATGDYYTQESANLCYTFPSLGFCGEYEDSFTNPGGINGVLETILTIIAWRASTAVADQLVDQGSSPKTEHKGSQDFGDAPGDAGTGALRSSPFRRLSADRWHHALISVDMTGGSAATGRAAGDSSSSLVSHITATSLMHVAVDNENYMTGSYPFENTNKVVTGSAMFITNVYQATKHDGETSTPVGPIPSYTLTGMSVPSGDIGMPAHGKYVDKIHHCELAEFQMFVGTTLDTSKESERRAFLDYKRDANDKPIPDNDGKARLKPVNPAVAEKLLGKPPILLHGSNKWIKGTNTGSGSAFKPTGEIKKYRPDPAVLPR